MRVAFVIFSVIFLAGVAFAEGAMKELPNPNAASNTTKVIAKYHQGTVISQGEAGVGNTRVFKVKAEDAEAFAEQLRAQPEVDKVALDLIAQNPPMLSASPAVLSSVYAMSAATGLPLNGAPSDPGFQRQVSWTSPDDFSRGVQNILAGYLASERNKTLRVGVLDSGFYPVADIVFSSGYNLASVDGYGPRYLENEINPECTSPHGTAVAGIIGAAANNGDGIAGILDAELVAARVLSCNSGNLSDAALGIRWLAGDPSVTEAPALNSPVDIINASFGIRTGQCPFYLQEAIDYAYQEGVLVVVAAGNNTRNAQHYTPANCQHVITVGAVDKTGKLSYFSNYGDLVDLMALGEDVASVNREGEIDQWSGTSFAAPLVTGAAGLLKQADPSLTPDELRRELIAASRPINQPISSPGAEGQCGGIGVVDAGKAVNNLMADLDEQRPRVQPVLNAVERYNREAYIENTPAGVDYEKLFEVSVGSVELASEDEFYALFKTTETNDKELLFIKSDSTFLVTDVEPANDQLWFDVCDSEGQNCRFNKNQPLVF